MNISSLAQLADRLLIEWRLRSSFQSFKERLRRAALLNTSKTLMEEIALRHRPTRPLPVNPKD